MLIDMDLPVRLKAIVECGTFDSFNKEWVIIEQNVGLEYVRSNPDTFPKGTVKYIVNLIKNDILESQINIEQYHREFQHEVEIQTYIPLKKVDMNTRLDTLLNNWRARYSHHLMDLNKITLDFKSFGEIEGLKTGL
jgi:hypothetical protein